MSHAGARKWFADGEMAFAKRARDLLRSPECRTERGTIGLGTVVMGPDGGPDRLVTLGVNDDLAVNREPDALHVVWYGRLLAAVLTHPSTKQSLKLVESLARDILAARAKNKGIQLDDVVQGVITALLRRPHAARGFMPEADDFDSMARQVFRYIVLTIRNAGVDELERQCGGLRPCRRRARDAAGSDDETGEWEAAALPRRTTIYRWYRDGLIPSRKHADVEAYLAHRSEKRPVEHVSAARAAKVLERKRTTVLKTLNQLVSEGVLDLHKVRGEWVVPIAKLPVIAQRLPKERRGYERAPRTRSTKLRPRAFPAHAIVFGGDYESTS